MDQELKDINARLDNLMAFLAENMVTKQELDERLQTLATKQDFHDLLTSVDGIAKRLTKVSYD